MQTLNGPIVHRISPAGKEKVYGGEDMLKSQVLSSEWKTERVRELKMKVLKVKMVIVMQL